MKNHKIREIKLPASIAKMLQGHRRGCPDDLVFTSVEGRPIDMDNFRSRAWKTVLMELGIDYTKPYNTRKSAITNALMAGTDPVTLAQAIGNTPSTIYRFYVNRVKVPEVLPDWTVK